MTEAVITVPAYFTDAQRQATKDAGQIAGLNVKRIINEPTAAALSYGIDKEEEQRIMVYDLGGGTFDVSIIEMGDGIQQVLATAGNNRLGGDDFDQRIINWMVDEFKKTEGIDLSNDKMAVQRLKDAAEKAKIELSSTTTTNINIPFITADANGAKHLDMNLTVAKFNELTKDLVDATMGPVQQALSDSGLSPSDLNKVLMVGVLREFRQYKRLFDRSSAKNRLRELTRRMRCSWCRISGWYPRRRCQGWSVAARRYTVVAGSGNHGRRMYQDHRP